MTVSSIVQYSLLHRRSQFSSVQPLDRLSCRVGHGGRFSTDPLPVFSAKGPCEQFWHGQGVHSLTLSIQISSADHSVTPPPHPQTSKVPLRMVLERLSWRVTCPNHSSFHVVTVARRGSLGSTRRLILLWSGSRSRRNNASDYKDRSHCSCHTSIYVGRRPVEKSHWMADFLAVRKTKKNNT